MISNWTILSRLQLRTSSSLPLAPPVQALANKSTNPSSPHPPSQKRSRSQEGQSSSGHHSAVRMMERDRAKWGPVSRFSRNKTPTRPVTRPTTQPSAPPPQHPAELTSQSIRPTVPLAEQRLQRPTSPWLHQNLPPSSSNKCPTSPWPPSSPPPPTRASHWPHPSCPLPRLPPLGDPQTSAVGMVVVVVGDSRPGPQ
jgi:hypothetical protein